MVTYPGILLMPDRKSVEDAPMARRTSTEVSNLTRSEFLRLLALPVAAGVMPRVCAGQDSTHLSEALPPLNARLETAHCSTEGDTLVVSTGRIERRWRWTGKGLMTVGLRDLARGREWCSAVPALACDWAYPGLIEDSSSARMVSLTAAEGNDEGFTSQHLGVTAEIEYPAQGLTLRYVIWTYPDAPGIRTQLWVRGDRRPSPRGAEGRVDYLPVDLAKLRPRAIFAGYYNDTQHRDKPETELLREEVQTPSSGGATVVDWASLASLEVQGSGLMFIKESHKCVNQSGVNTGGFVLNSSGFHNTGWGLAMEDLTPESAQWCWAAWVIVHDATEDGRELALKQFDRLRFPTLPSRDAWTLACTWGSSSSWVDGQMAAREKEILLEMDSVADLGIDLLQIDSGWQVGPGGDMNRPIPTHGWRPDPQSYPDGWHNVAARRKQLGVRLGLWAAAQPVPLEDLEWNWQQLELTQFKLDFAKLNGYAEMVKLIDKVRKFELFTGHRCIVGWDTTENAPRFGYYWAREYGDMHFMNRKPKTPANAIYIPWLALRDFWQLARYNNLNKWQLVTQNPESIDPELSDATQHSAAYCLAATLMGVPEFMTLTRNYGPESRRQVRSLLKLFKPHQEPIFQSFVFPIGEQPTNASWAGFQACLPDSDSGYLLILRERLNQSSQQRVPLRFLPANSKIEVQDLLNGQTRKVILGEDRSLDLALARPADFLFLRYTREG